MPYKKVYRRRRFTKAKRKWGTRKDMGLMQRSYPYGPRPQIYKPTKLVLKGIGILPDQMMVKLTYSSTHTLTSTSGSLATYQFRQNSVYDPDFTGTGHQPLGYDEYANLYDRYVVYGTKVSIAVSGVTTGVPGILSLRGSPNSTLPASSITQAIESPRVRWKLIGNLEGVNVNAVSAYYTTKALAGVSSLGQERDYRSSVTTNPSEVNYINVCWQSANEASTSACNIIVKIVYYVKFFDRKTLSQS